MYKIFALVVVLVAPVIAVHESVASPSATQLSDPTRPLGYRTGTTKKHGLKLQAIFYGEGRREAIVSGVAVKEGEVIHGKRIVKIQANAVIYESAGQRHTLALRPSIFKQ